MKINIGPVEPGSARAWVGWVRKVLGALRRESAGTLTLPAHVLDSVGSYVDSWARAARNAGDAFRLQVDVHPEELEYLTNSLYNLDTRLADKARPCPGGAEPAEGRAFHDVLVEALLFALAQAGRSHAAFAEHLRLSWPVRAPDRVTVAPPTESPSGGAPRRAHVTRSAASTWDVVRPRLRCARSRS